MEVSGYNGGGGGRCVQWRRNRWRRAGRRGSQGAWRRARATLVPAARCTPGSWYKRARLSTGVSRSTRVADSARSVPGCARRPVTGCVRRSVPRKGIGAYYPTWTSQSREGSARSSTHACIACTPVCVGQYRCVRVGQYYRVRRPVRMCLRRSVRVCVRRSERMCVRVSVPDNALSCA
eukprot:3600505-Rhodomonas_salina.1